MLNVANHSMHPRPADSESRNLKRKRAGYSIANSGKSGSGDVRYVRKKVKVSGPQTPDAGSPLDTSPDTGYPSGVEIAIRSPTPESSFEQEYQRLHDAPPVDTSLLYGRWKSKRRRKQGRKIAKQSAPPIKALGHKATSTPKPSRRAARRTRRYWSSQVSPQSTMGNCMCKHGSEASPEPAPRPQPNPQEAVRPASKASVPETAKQKQEANKAEQHPAPQEAQPAPPPQETQPAPAAPQAPESQPQQDPPPAAADPAITDAQALTAATIVTEMHALTKAHPSPDRDTQVRLWRLTCALVEQLPGVLEKGQRVGSSKARVRFQIPAYVVARLDPYLDFAQMDVLANLAVLRRTLRGTIMFGDRVDATPNMYNKNGVVWADV